MSRILQFSCKLNTRRLVKSCPFRFLRDYSGNSLDVMFSQFPNHFLSFSMVFPHVSPSVSRFPWMFLLFSLSVFPVFYFRFSKHSDPALNFNNNIIYHATSQKHLGIILDNRLSFKKLLRLVFSKINKITGFLRKRQCLIPR